MTWPSDRSRDGGIDEVPLGPGVAGRLFLCGKHAICGDPEAVLARVGATTVVCLNDLDELRDRFPEYEKWLATNAPARALHHPIHDFCAPPLAALTTLVDELHTRLLAGE